MLFMIPKPELPYVDSVTYEERPGVRLELSTIDVDGEWVLVSLPNSSSITMKLEYLVAMVQAIGGEIFLNTDDGEPKTYISSPIQKDVE